MLEMLMIPITVSRFGPISTLTYTTEDKLTDEAISTSPELEDFLPLRERMFLLFPRTSAPSTVRNSANIPVLVQLKLGDNAVGRSNANLNSLARNFLAVKAFNVDHVALAVDGNDTAFFALVVAPDH